jgi:hypothetical protein
MTMGRCDVCGFEFDRLHRADVRPRVTTATEAIVRLLADESSLCGERPSPERWSVIEYGAHVRDVLLTIRDRLVIGLVEDNPTFQSLYRDQRVDMGLYAADTAAAIIDELRAATAMFLRLFDAVAPDLLLRPVRYGHPDPQPRTLLWMGLQAVHESEHHLGDAKDNLARLSAR